MKHNFIKNSISLLAAALLLTGCAKGQANASASKSTSSGIASAASNSAASSAIQEATSSIPVTANAPQQSTTVPDAFFDDAVFIGDSVSLKLKNYTLKQRKNNKNLFGNAQFLAAGSMGTGNALKPVTEDSIHPLVEGKKRSLPDGVNVLHGKKVYIMLGINDIAVYGTASAVENMTKLLEQIKTAVPDAEFYVQSATPILKEKQKEKLNNASLQEYNEKLKAKAQEKGWHYLDVASVLKDTEGNLKKEYCSDPQDNGLHFTDTACQIWADYLYTHSA